MVVTIQYEGGYIPQVHFDQIGMFLKQRVKKASGQTLRFNDLTIAFQDWCRDRDDHPTHLWHFITPILMEDLGYSEVYTSRGTYFEGLALKTPSDTMVDFFVDEDL